MPGCPVMNTTRLTELPRSSSKSSRPFPSGSMRSRSRTSGPSLPRMRRASSSRSAVSTVCPCIVSSSRVAATKSGSSSTSNTFAILSAPEQYGYARILPELARSRRERFDPLKNEMQNRTSMGAPYANHMAAWIRSFTAVAALFVVANGAAVLVGWGYGLAWLRSPAPSFGVMIPGSAAASACLGLAVLVGLGRPRFGTSSLRWLLELAAALLGVAVLAEYSFGIDLGIDGWP